MRGLAAILTTGFLIGTPAWSAETSFPYAANVSVDEVEVRCGPGWEYYPTLRLKRGTTVEVYRHEPGGWLAIRPPQRSFSWLPARQVKRDQGAQVGKVAIDGAVAWVGSDISNVQQHKWQVRLERDELIEVLGNRSLSVGPGFATETYLQIAPPAGEFRWIHAENAVAPQSMAHRSSGRTIELTDYTTPGASAANAASSGSASPPQASTTATSAATADQDLVALERQVTQLKLDLSLLVSRSIDLWELQSLRQRSDALAKSTKGTALARQVRLISYRIGEFETLHQRHQRMIENPSGRRTDPRVDRHGVSPAPRREPSALKPTEVQQTSWQREIEEAIDGNEVVGTGIDRLAQELAQTKPQFDAEGLLMPVHSTRRVAPPFALLDDDGRVICYVQPSPGLNLRRYARKHVGLFGDKRQITELRASLMTVTRVVKRK